MPATKLHNLEKATLQPARRTGWKGRGPLRLYAAGLLLLVNLTCLHQAVHAAGLTLQSAGTGITLTPFGVHYRTSFGNLNALGIGPASQAGVNIIPLSNGALYYSTYQLQIGGLGSGESGYVTAYVHKNFANPAALQVQSCPSSSGCATSGGYSAMSTSVGAQTVVLASPGLQNGQIVTAGLAIFVPDNDGASAFTGSDSATIYFTLYNFDNGNTVVNTVHLDLNLPTESVQTAVSLQLATSGSGLTVTAASDYSMNFGNVNALGIGPGAGLATVAAAGGIVYQTPYLVQAAFTGFTQTTGTVTVYVSTDFVHPVILELRDSNSSGGPYGAISKVAGAPTQITNAATDRSSTTRYLGLFVSNINGATAFSGTDSATLTYTLTVP